VHTQKCTPQPAGVNAMAHSTGGMAGLVQLCRRDTGALSCTRPSEGAQAGTGTAPPVNSQSASCLSEGRPSHSTVAFRGQPPVTASGCQSDPKGGRFVPLKRAKPEGEARRGTLAGYAGGFRRSRRGARRGPLWHPGPP
jgi:hypothetical protein